jgi:hypothetical protein
MTPFAILLEGDFTLVDFDPAERFVHVDPDRVLVKEKATTKRVVEVMKPALGQNIIFSMHHVPVVMNPFQWGGGNCIWQPEGWCPAGHHLDPLCFFHLQETGILGIEEGVWGLRTFMGKWVPISFHSMVGHFGRIASATVLDAERMKEELLSMGPEALETVGVSAKEAAEILGRMTKKQ